MAPVAKRRKIDQVEEITFNPEARQEYLTGFHKRKLQRIENARELAAKRDKEERVKARKELRDQRKEDLSRHVAEVNAELRKLNPDLSESDSAPEINGQEEDWEGIEEGKPEVAQDEEYVDEDKYTTVTVEAMKDPRDASEDDAEPKKAGGYQTAANGRSKIPKKRTWNKEDKAKSKKKKFRYESKAERSIAKQKQKSKNHAAMIRRKGK